MNEKFCDNNKELVFIQYGLKPHQKGYNCHHIIEKNDKKRKLIPSSFKINSTKNLIPLPEDTHNELHEIMDNNPLFKDDITCRVYFANMAINGELDLIPERFYRIDPTIRK